MRTKKSTLKLLLTIIPAFLIYLNLADIYDVLYGKMDYPFGTEFTSAYSIYRTKTIYLLFILFFTIALSLTITLLFKEKWKWVVILFIINLLFFIYPILTGNE